MITQPSLQTATTNMDIQIQNVTNLKTKYEIPQPKPPVLRVLDDTVSTQAIKLKLILFKFYLKYYMLL